MKLHLSELNAVKLLDRRKRFLVKQWENKKERIPGTDRYKTFMHWRHDRLSNQELLDVYVKLLHDMSSHSFFAAWNFHQYLVCKNNIEKGQIVIVHDYAQNYLCLHQHKPQGLHWSHAQVTIHPSCITYRCPVDGCNQKVLHEIVHISDDGKHDAHLVKKFQNTNLKLLNSQGVEIRKIIEFTDQAPNQYKNKSAFRYLSQDKIPVQRNFFGVRHGKGPCDACAGRVKNKLSTLVRSQTVVVNSAKTCYEALKQHLETQWPAKTECMHYMLSVNFTPKISKRPNTLKWKGVKDTRAHMHSIMNTGKDLQVNVRDITCLCPGCLHGDSECKNKNYVDSWRGHFILKKSFFLYYCRAIKLPALGRAVKSRGGGHSSSNVRHNIRSKVTEKEEEGEQDPLGSSPEIVEIDMEEEKPEKPTKQVARRGRSFSRGRTPIRKPEPKLKKCKVIVGVTKRKSTNIDEDTKNSNKEDEAGKKKKKG